MADTPETPASARRFTTHTPVQTPAEAASAPAAEPKPVEYGGPKGLEPTRFGDWERGGRCSDF